MQIVNWEPNIYSSPFTDRSKRYWLFTFAQYEPSGGMLDFAGSFDSLEQCMDAVDAELRNPSEKNPFCCECGNVYDSLEGKTIARFDNHRG